MCLQGRFEKTLLDADDDFHYFFFFAAAQKVTYRTVLFNIIIIVSHIQLTNNVDKAENSQNARIYFNIMLLIIGIYFILLYKIYM